MENLELMEQGAEARLYIAEYFGRPAIIKERFDKQYRHPMLNDHILRERLRAEARSLLRSRIAGIYIHC